MDILSSGHWNVWTTLILVPEHGAQAPAPSLNSALLPEIFHVKSKGFFHAGKKIAISLVDQKTLHDGARSYMWCMEILCKRNCTFCSKKVEHLWRSSVCSGKFPFEPEILAKWKANVTGSGLKYTISGLPLLLFSLQSLSFIYIHANIQCFIL